MSDKTLASVAVFVHGFGSSAACWQPLLSLLQQDARVKARYELECFEYPTKKWFSPNPLRRIPRLREIARYLKEFIDSPRFHERDLTLVGHSQGGLVIQSYLADLLEAGQGERLEAVRQVILVATPNLGSTLLSPLRKLAYAVIPNPQERTLRVLDPEIADIRGVITERVLGARQRDKNAWPVPIAAFYGLQDAVVVEASARGPFSNVVPLEGDHFSILKPRDATDARCRELVEALLEPVGHPGVYLVDSYDTTIQVEPLPGVQDIICKHGTKAPRTVQTDNVAHISRGVTFSSNNCCTMPFTLRYATRKGGYVNPTTSHENEASPEERGRYDDNGVEAIFKFTPKPRGTYTLKVDVYKGYDAGNRDVHFHLGRSSYYNKVRVTVDLTPYVKAGYTVQPSPHLYVHAHDPINHDVCKQRGIGTPIEPLVDTPDGVWQWELRGLRQGVVDIVWDVVAPGRT